MAEHILVPYDGSPLSRRALERAITVHPGAEITVLHVIDPIDVVYEAESKGLPETETWHDRRSERASELCADAASRAAERDCEVATAIRTGSPAREILEYVDEHGIDHVVVGSHGRSGISRLVLGSVAERVMRQCPVPVTVVR